MIKELFLLLFECLRSPKTYLDRIIKNNQTKHQIVLLALIGITLTFNKNLEGYLDGQHTLLGFLAIYTFGGIFGWMGLYFYSYVIGLVGVFFNSKIDTNKIINIIAYAYIPILLILFISIIELIVFSIDGSLNDNRILLILLELIKAIIQIYCFFFIIVGVSRVQGLSYFKGFLTTIIPIIALLLIIYGFSMIFK